MRTVGPRWPPLERPSRFDARFAVVVAVGLVGGTVLATSTGSDSADVRPLGGVGYVLVVLGGLVLAFRNVAPTRTYAAALVMALAYEIGAYAGGPGPLPTVVALYTLAAHGHRLRALGLGLLATVLLVGGRAMVEGLESPMLVVFPTTVVAALFAGQVVAGRRATAVESRRREAADAQQREVDTRRRVDAERLRIARELHDVVAHSISLIHVQATMGAHVMESRPAEAAGALLAIKAASKQALRELRGILDVLREVDDDATRPAPGLGDLDALVSTTAAAGLAVEARLRGVATPLPVSVDVTAYRIIQESLTNALRHAPESRTEVIVDFQPRALVVVVTDDGSGHRLRPPLVGTSFGAGHGITGMRERASALGGTLEAAPGPRGGFTVRARLPLEDTL